MTMATLTYIPARHGSSRTSSTTISWRKLFSSPASRRKNDRCPSSSPMVLAGATEKFIRHLPAEITCGDLTAREFAMLAGISTATTTTTTTTSTTSLEEKDPSSTKSQDDLPSPKIWDQDFWLHPSKSASTTTTTTTSPIINDDPCYHQKHRNSVPNIILRGRFQICVGEDNSNDAAMAISPSFTPHVVEWKRKKSV